MNACVLCGQLIVALLEMYYVTKMQKKTQVVFFILL